MSAYIFNHTYAVLHSLGISELSVHLSNDKSSIWALDCIYSHFFKDLAPEMFPFFYPHYQSLSVFIYHTICLIIHVGKIPILKNNKSVPTFPLPTVWSFNLALLKICLYFSTFTFFLRSTPVHLIPPYHVHQQHPLWPS